MFRFKKALDSGYLSLQVNTKKKFLFDAGRSLALSCAPSFRLLLIRWLQSKLKVGEADVRSSFKAHLPDIPILEESPKESPEASPGDGQIEQRSAGAAPPMIAARFFAGYVRDSMPKVAAFLDRRNAAAVTHAIAGLGDIAILRIDLGKPALKLVSCLGNASHRVRTRKKRNEWYEGVLLYVYHTKTLFLFCL